MNYSIIQLSSRFYVKYFPKVITAQIILRSLFAALFLLLTLILEYTSIKAVGKELIANFDLLFIGLSSEALVLLFFYGILALFSLVAEHGMLIYLIHKRSLADSLTTKSFFKYLKDHLLLSALKLWIYCGISLIFIVIILFLYALLPFDYFALFSLLTTIYGIYKLITIYIQFNLANIILLNKRHDIFSSLSKDITKKEYRSQSYLLLFELLILFTLFLSFEFVHYNALYFFTTFSLPTFLITLLLSLYILTGSLLSILLPYLRSSYTYFNYHTHKQSHLAFMNTSSSHSLLTFLTFAVSIFTIGVLITTSLFVNFTAETLENPTLIIAHRGDSALYIENTLPAIESAYNNGADMIEIDVQITSDNVLILFHDIDTSRFNSQHYTIERTPATTLTNLTLNHLNTTSSIPTLEDIFKQYGNTLQYLIELKIINVSRSLRMIQELERLLTEYNLHNVSIVTSLNTDLLQEYQHTFPQTRLVYTLSFFVETDETSSLPGISVNELMITPDFMLRQNNLPNQTLYVWSFIPNKDLSPLYAVGVDGIIIDNVSLAYTERALYYNLSTQRRLYERTLYLNGR